MLEDLDLRRAPVSRDDYFGDMPQAMPTNGTLATLNLDSELYSMYARAKNYLDDLQMGDDNTPANQVAQVMNTITAILKEIVKMQTDLYNAERVKKLEAAMIEALKNTATEEVQDAFFTELERLSVKVL